MAQTKVAINGFGRIGRLTFKDLLDNEQVDVVAINDLTDTHTLAHLLKYDTAHGHFDREVKVHDEGLEVDGRDIKVTAIKDPAELPWSSTEVDVVLESTGLFLKREDAQKHLDAGAKKVVLSAPAKSEDIPTFVQGVNDNVLTSDVDIISNASCTTNCFAPMVKVLDELGNIQEGLMSTIHAYTADQAIQDGPHKDLRRARAAAQNIIPTSTGAAKATTKVLPHLDGKLSAVAYRVPVITGSLTDFSATLEKDVSVDEVKEAFREAGGGALSNVLEYADEPLVSTDIMGNKHSCIFDSLLTDKAANTIKIVGWYDNESGYSQRTADLIDRMRAFL
jgi:glyceraldehyde 3-phosphate dehydrogenase